MWEGIGYIYLQGCQYAEALGLIPKKTAVDWFLEELWYLWSSAFTVGLRPDLGVRQGEGSGSGVRKWVRECRPQSSGG